MLRTHVLCAKHLANPSNPPYLCLETPRAAHYAYRTAACGQTAYCRENPDEPMTYADQFGPVPFVSWRKPELVTCKTCQKAMSK